MYDIIFDLIPAGQILHAYYARPLELKIRECMLVNFEFLILTWNFEFGLDSKFGF